MPDIYQGDELWDLALVDPDNRRPVDWDLRRRLLDEVAAGAPPRRETAKLFLIHRALALRARRPEAFAGDYRPLGAGPAAFAYARGGDRPRGHAAASRGRRRGARACPATSPARGRTSSPAAASSCATGLGWTG